MSDKDYNIEELLSDHNENYVNVDEELSLSEEMLRAQLEAASKDVEKRLDQLGKLLKKEIKHQAINLYHNNKDLAKSGLKGANSAIKDILKGLSKMIDQAIESTNDPAIKKELRKVRWELAKFSMQYNHKYTMLRMKLALGSAGIDIKDFFKS